jgi:hypothetical protein
LLSVSAFEVGGLAAVQAGNEGKDVVRCPNDVEVRLDAIGLGPSDLAPVRDPWLDEPAADLERYKPRVA